MSISYTQYDFVVYSDHKHILFFLEFLDHLEWVNAYHLLEKSIVYISKNTQYSFRFIITQI